MEDNVINTYYWVAKVSDLYNYPYELIDGPHDDEESAAVGLYLHKRLFPTKTDKLSVVEVKQLNTRPSSKGVNHEAIKANREAMYGA